MRILLTGATGLIGGAVLRHLTGAHAVTALIRRVEAAPAIEAAGAVPLAGTLSGIADAVRGAPRFDALIHCAADFAATNMGAAEVPLIDALACEALPLVPGARVLYTGGVWLYPAGAASVRDETDPLDPLPAFAWMVAHWRRIAALPGITPGLIHPGLVFDDQGRGAIAPLLADIEAGGPVRATGGPHVHWPMVHADDLGALYALALRRLPAGESVNGVGAAGLPVAAVINALAAERGRPAPTINARPVADAEADQGISAAGFARDQRVSGAKARRLGWTPRHPVPGASRKDEG